jgi:hypothetical protein
MRGTPNPTFPIQTQNLSNLTFHMPNPFRHFKHLSKFLIQPPNMRHNKALHVSPRPLLTIRENNPIRTRRTTSILPPTGQNRELIKLHFRARRRIQLCGTDAEFLLPVAEFFRVGLGNELVVLAVPDAVAHGVLHVGSGIALGAAGIAAAGLQGGIFGGDGVAEGGGGEEEESAEEGWDVHFEVEGMV